MFIIGFSDRAERSLVDVKSLNLASDLLVVHRFFLHNNVYCCEEQTQTIQRRRALQSTIIRLIIIVSHPGDNSRGVISRLLYSRERLWLLMLEDWLLLLLANSLWSLSWSLSAVRVKIDVLFVSGVTWNSALDEFVSLYWRFLALFIQSFLKKRLKICTYLLEGLRVAYRHRSQFLKRGHFDYPFDPH